MIQIHRFWDFVAARQEIWYKRRVLKQEEPWSDDPIFLDKRFTNIYRCLDKGTLFSLYELLGYGTDQERIFNVIAYRLLNRIESYSILRQSVAIWTKQWFLDRVNMLRSADQPIMTGAFVSVSMVTGGTERGVVPKIAAALDLIRENIRAITYDLKMMKHSKDAHEYIRAMAGPEYRIGPFISYQILLDLMYPGGIVDVPSGEWVYMGPGSTKAIKNLGREHGLTAMDMCKVLYLSQTAQLSRRGFKFLRREEDGGIYLLSLADIEHALCEWYKYEKLVVGGHGKVFKGPTYGYVPPKPIPPWIKEEEEYEPLL